MDREGLNLKLHIWETTSVQMSCVAALVAGNGKIVLLRGRTHTIRIWRVGRWWVARVEKGDAGGVKERERGTRREGPVDRK